MLVSTWGNWSLREWLVETDNGAVAVENRMAGPHKIKHRMTM